MATPQTTLSSKIWPILFILQVRQESLKGCKLAIKVFATMFFWYGGYRRRLKENDFSISFHLDLMEPFLAFWWPISCGGVLNAF